MLEKVKREVSYIAHDYYRVVLTLIIDGKEYKEYSEEQLCSDGKVTASPESLEDQLHRLVPDVDVNLITEFLSYVENTYTSEGFDNVQKMWDDIVVTQESFSNTDKFKELGRFIAETRGTLAKKGGGICDVFATAVTCQRCPFNNKEKCRLSLALVSLKALQDACEVKGGKK